MDNKETEISLNIDMNDFDGVTAQMFQISSIGSESRLDAIYVDIGAIVNNESQAQGKIVARINMTTDRLKELRDMLNDHFNNIKPEEKDDAE